MLQRNQITTLRFLLAREMFTSYTSRMSFHDFAYWSAMAVLVGTVSFAVWSVFRLFREDVPPIAPVASKPDPHAECRKKRRVLIEYKGKKKYYLWDAFVLEEFEGRTQICNAEGNGHQWVTAKQVKELVPLTRDFEIDELRKLYSLDGEQ